MHTLSTFQNHAYFMTNVKSLKHLVAKMWLSFPAGWEPCVARDSLTDYAFSYAHGQAPRLLNFKYAHLIVAKNSFQNIVWDETSKLKLLFNQHVLPHTVVQLKMLETTNSEKVLEYSTPHISLIKEAFFPCLISQRA